VAVRLRLKRTGRRHRACFRLGVFDSRTPRDGRAIEEVGIYDPGSKDPAKQLVLEKERIEHWLKAGALPSDTVGELLKRGGIVVKVAKAEATA
jgi:small subunit ribosomal protein S16